LAPTWAAGGALSRREFARETNSSAPVDTALAGVYFAAWAAAVIYGFYLLIPQFH
jgi:hypothetical protein